MHEAVCVRNFIQKSQFGGLIGDFIRIIIQSDRIKQGCGPSKGDVDVVITPFPLDGPITFIQPQ